MHYTIPLKVYHNNFFRAQFPNLTLTNHSKFYVPKLGQKIKNKNFSMNQYFLWSLQHA